MNGRESTQSLLALRKLTRAITEIARAQLTDYLSTLAPLLRPKVVLGEFVDGGSKETTRRGDKAFKELQALYETVASAKPFHVQQELAPPLRFPGTGLEITAVDYAHAVPSGADTRTIMVRSPLVWTLTYAGYGPTRLSDLLKTRPQRNEELAQFVLSYLMLHVVTTNSPGLMQVLDALHFPITTVTLPEFGPLPVTRIGASISTERPSDDVILESAELTGMDAFEEVVHLDDLARLRDPFKERLIENVRQQAPQLA